MTIAALVAAEPAQLTDRALQARITSPDAQCVGSASDPDEWFPLAAEPGKARAQSSHALALCGVCAVRTECWNWPCGTGGTSGGMASGAGRLSPSVRCSASSGFPASASRNC